MKTELLDKILGFESRPGGQLSKYSEQAIWFLVSDGLKLNCEEGDSISSTLGMLCNSESIYQHRHYRRGSVQSKLPSTDGSINFYRTLRDFLFTAQGYDFTNDALAISHLRLYLLAKSFKASRSGFSVDKSIEFICKTLVSALMQRAELNSKILRVFTDLPSKLDIDTRLVLWCIRLKQIGADETSSNKSKLKAFVDQINKVIKGDFTELIAGKIERLSITSSPRSFEQLEEPSPWDDKDTGGNSLKKFNASTPTQHGVFRANLGRAFRISQNALNLNPQHLHYWPQLAVETFEAHIQNLKQSDLLNMNLKSLLLEVSKTTGLSILEILHLQVLNHPTHPTSQDWYLTINNKEICLGKLRPKRVESTRMPMELSDYCMPIGQGILIPLIGYKKGFVELFGPDMNGQTCTLGTVVDRCNIWGNFEFSASTTDEQLSAWLLGSIVENNIFNLQSIRFQAFGTLKSRLNSEATAELALARPDQSTSAITAYLCHGERGLNVAGSQIAFTDKGICSFIAKISDRFLNAVEELSGNLGASWVELVNLASQRLWVIELMTLGRRPVSTGIECLTEIDSNFEYAFLLDKFVEDREEGRIVFMPPLLRNELQQYLEILCSIFDQASPLSDDLKQLFSKNRRPLFSILSVRKNSMAQEVMYVEEISSKEVFLNFIPEAQDAKNCFRHYWIQKIFEKSQSMELTRAFAGHNDELQMIYGSTSNRCRKADLEAIGKIASTVSNSFQMETDRFWADFKIALQNSLNSNLTYMTPTVSFPIRVGRDLRKQNREQQQILAVNLLELKMNTLERTLRRDLVASEEEIDQARKIFFQNLSSKETSLGSSKLNGLLRKYDWPISFYEMKNQQIFPSPELMTHLKRRERFFEWLSQNNEKLDERTRLSCQILELIYRYCLLNNTDLLRLMQKGWTRIVLAKKNCIYLEISRRYQFNDDESHQCFRIRLPQKMQTLDIDNLSRGFPLANLSSDLLKILDQNSAKNIQELLLRIQREAINIATFEQPAFVANNFGSTSSLTSSTNWTSLTFRSVDVDSKTSDYKQVAESSKSVPIKDTASSSVLKQSKARIYKALNRVNWREAKSELEKLESDLEYIHRIGGHAEIIRWAKYSIDKNKKSKLQPRSVMRYLSATFALVEIVGPLPFVELDDEDVDVLQRTFEDHISTRDDQQVWAAGANSFVSYLAEHVNEAFSDTWLQGGERLEKAVRAEWISNKDFHRTLREISTKFNKMSDECIVFLSLLYRFGLRLSEAKFIQLRDIYAIENSLLGVVVRANKFRNIKFRKPPRRLFINERDPLSSLEQMAWSRVISDRRNRFGIEKSLSLFFSEELVKTEFLLTLLETIRQTCGNARITFHSLRHSFANRRALTALPSPETLKKENGVSDEIYLESCNSLDFVRLGLRHATIGTSWTSYIHIADRYVEYQTRGLRRGTAIKKECGESRFLTIKDRDLKPNGRPKAAQIDTTSVDTYEGFNFVRIFIENKKIYLNQNEYRTFSSLLSNGIGFHSKAPRLSLDPDERTLTLTLPKFFQKLEPGSKVMETMISDLKSLQFNIDESLVQKVSKLPFVIGARGEILISTYEDFVWMKILGLRPDLIELQTPPLYSERVRITEIQYSKIFGIDAGELQSYKLHRSTDSISREVTDQGVGKGKSRVRMHYRSSNDRSITYLFFVLSVIHLVRTIASRSSWPNSQQPRLVY